MDTERERDLAVIARIGGNVYREEIVGLYYRGGKGLVEVDTYIGADPRRIRDFGRKEQTVSLPESAFDWPIYRAAILADIYGALWGQASPAEERVLDTLAHCAGLRPTLVPSEPLPVHPTTHIDIPLATGDDWLAARLASGQAEPVCWLFLNGLAEGFDENDQPIPSTYMDGGEEQARECRLIRKSEPTYEPCAVHG